MLLFKSAGIEEWGYQLRFDGLNGWNRYIKGPLEILELHVPHNALMKEPVVHKVVARINGLKASPAASIPAASRTRAGSAN